MLLTEDGFFVLFICLIPFFIRSITEQTENNSEILFDIDDWSHLKEQNVFIAFIRNQFDQKLFSQITNLINQRSPLTQFHKLTNITTIQQFQHFFSSKSFCISIFHRSFTYYL